MVAGSRRSGRRLGRLSHEKYCALGGKKSNAIRRSSSHKQQVLGGCYALILPYFCHESNFLFSRNMICQKNEKYCVLGGKKSDATIKSWKLFSNPLTVRG